MNKKAFLQSVVLFAGLVLTASSFAQQDDEDEDIRDIVFSEEELAEEASVETIDDEEDGSEGPGIITDFRSEDLDRDWEEAESEEERDRAELLRSFQSYKSSIDNQMYDEADTLAKRIVELSIKLYGINSHDSAKALTNLGTVQYHNKEFESAQLNYKAAIEIIERIEDRLHADLINPLNGLGAAQLAAGRPDLARDTFDHSVHISHVNDGPHNLRQIEMLDALTETYLLVGETSDALDVQENVYNLQVRNVDPDSEDVLPALERQANWMHRMQRYNSERNTYRRIIRILESSRGRDDLSLIPPLTGLGRSYLFVEPYDPEFQTYTPASGGEVYLKRALRIAENNPESNWEIQHISLLALGDFYTLTERANRAKKVYEETWELLSAEEDRIPSRIETMESPIILQSISPTRYYNSTRQDFGQARPENFERGTIVVGYSISKSGQSTNISLIESDPPGLVEMENDVLRNVRDLVYRPRFKDGEIVTVPDQTYTHEFFYRPSDVAAPAATGEIAGPAASNR
ncbi:MAG: tetratricopeptide repeat protein [Gammaproteobacteria bacterium]|nr:tetratricopeptide repeat protein [Gammaproteobacteria bacterium]MDH4313651.1 tetratricopeptide repeat protein [Gammaproteobacteria bacterium]MDH5213864.1 tetratricopeptide repeat protein [Gammaproteobacteria bacterium]